MEPALAARLPRSAFFIAGCVWGTKHQGEYSKRCHGKNGWDRVYIGEQLLKALGHEQRSNFGGRVLTALFIAGGSDGIFRIFSRLGIRDPKNRQEKAEQEQAKKRQAKAGQP